jgi:predicted kinase
MPTHVQAEVQWLTGPDTVSDLAYEPSALLMVAGVTGAGKSTLLERCAPAHAVLLSADTIRGAIQAAHGLPVDEYHPQHIPAARQVFLGDLRKALQAGRPVIVDATLVQSKARDELIAEAQVHQRPVHALVLDVTLGQALDGVSRRGPRAVKEKDVRRYYNLWAQWKRRLREGVVDQGLQSVAVLDREAAAALRHIHMG